MSPNIQLKSISSALLLASASLGWHSAVFAAEVQRPNAGTILQQTQTISPTLPASATTKQKKQAPANVADSKPFAVSQINIVGNTLFETAQLHRLIADSEDSNITLLGLKALAQRITDYYREQGYSLSRAVIPQQSIENGLVTIQVIEAHLGKISIDNKSRVRGSLIANTIDPLPLGKAIKQDTLERALYLLNDLPGTKVRANLSAGKEAGSTDIHLNATSSPMYTGRVTLDDYGNSFINRERIGASVYAFNPLNQGDLLSVNAVSTGELMKYASVDYSLTLNGLGTRLGGSYGILDYELGSAAKSLNVHGNATTSGLWIQHPLIRSAKKNLYVKVQYNYSGLEDRVDASNIKSDRHVDTVAAILSGDIRDEIMGGGINSMNVQFTSGNTKFDDATAKTSDSVTANTAGSFSKWSINLSRLQAITDKTTLWLSASAQMAQDNLDSSQKMVFGGPFSVRGYDSGAVSGDSGFLATMELRHMFGNFHGAIQGVAFVDTGSVKVNNTLWDSTTGDNTATLSGAGIGVNWFGDNQWIAKASVATSLGDSSELTKDADNTVAWLEISKGF